MSELKPYPGMTDNRKKGGHSPIFSLPHPPNTIVTPAGVILPRKSVDRRRYFAGFTAGCVSRTLTAPIDRLKVLRQAAAPEIEGLNMYRSEFILLIRCHIDANLDFSCTCCLINC